MSTTENSTVTGTYAIDPTHSRVGFVARHAMVTKVRGSFNQFEGTGHFDIENPSNSSVQLTIQATSIDTRNEDRDNHLRSGDFFDMEQYPEITFVSTNVVGTGQNTYAVTGDLTMKGVTNPVTIDFTYEGAVVDPFGASRIGFEASSTVNRSYWGINFNAPLEAGGLLVSEKITLEFEVSAVLSES